MKDYQKQKIQPKNPAFAGLSGHSIKNLSGGAYGAILEKLSG
ncbi:MAG: hypothetical protein WC517_02625 [Patescibacteria group bacterium]